MKESYECFGGEGREKVYWEIMKHEIILIHFKCINQSFLVTGYEKGEGSWPLSLDKGIMEVSVLYSLIDAVT